MSSEAAGTRVILIEDQTTFRELLSEVLTATLGCEIVGQLSEGGRAVEECQKLKPDLVILDALLPDINGVEVLSNLMGWHTGLPVIMVTAHAKPALVRQSVEAGARGFVTKGTPLSELREAILRVLRGGRYYCSEASSLLAEALRHPETQTDLTKRQREILRLVATGLSSRDIAEQLTISQKTVDNHRLQIREKLGLHDVASWTRYAIEHGYIEAKA